jgi:protein-disulfide isomerase
VIGLLIGYFIGAAGKPAPAENPLAPAAEKVEKYLPEAKGLASTFPKGPKAAKVTIVEISDFQCPFCKRAHDTVAQLIEKYGDNLKVHFVNLPLAFHKRALPAAKAAHAAGLQGKFFEYHDILFENNQALEDADLEAYAKQLSLDLDKWKKDKDAKETADAIDRQARLANALGVTGTPGFFVNGEQVKGAKPIEEFAPIIDAQLAKADALVKNGVPLEKVHAALSRGSMGGSYYKYILEGAEPPTAQAQAAAKPPLGERVFDIPMDDSGRIGEGNEVVLTEFSDFQCPFCSRVVPMLDEVVNHYGPQRASLVFKNFPLSFHKQAGLAAEAVLAANAQGKFKEMYHKLFDNQKALERTSLEKYAEEIGLNLDRFKADLDNGTFKKAVEADMALGTKVGVGGTPTIFINGRLYNGERTTEDMIKIIDQKILGKKAQ